MKLGNGLIDLDHFEICLLYIRRREVFGIHFQNNSATRKAAMG